MKSFFERKVLILATKEIGLLISYPKDKEDSFYQVLKQSGNIVILKKKEFLEFA